MPVKRKFSAKNTISKSADLFHERMRYKLYAYEADFPTPSDSVIKDFWQFENLFYGRVDYEQNIILPNKKLFKRLPSKSKETFWAFDFVVDAFNDLLKTATMRIRDGGLPLENVDGSEERYIGPYQVGRAYADVGKAYNEHISSIFDIFYKDYLITRNKIEQISDFEDFMKIFMEFVRIGLVPAVPLNQSAYCLSRFSSVLGTGLAIEMGKFDHGDDKGKQEFFLDNRRLEIHKNLAAKYGFFIDKNAPWRLVANLESEQMKEYIQKRYPENVDLTSFFAHYYEKTTGTDIHGLRNLMVRMYNQVVTNKPITRTPYQKKGRTHYKVTNRQRITTSASEVYDDLYWTEKYIQIKNMESKLAFSEAEEVKIIKNARDLIKGVDFERAMSYIDYKFRGFVNTPTSYQYNEWVKYLTSDGRYDSEKIGDIISIIGRSENTVMY